MNKIGSKIIDGKMLNLDEEPIENLEKIAEMISEKEETIKFDLDGIMNQMIK